MGIGGVAAKRRIEDSDVEKVVFVRQIVEVIFVVAGDNVGGVKIELGGINLLPENSFAVRYISDAQSAAAVVGGNIKAKSLASFRSCRPG